MTKTLTEQWKDGELGKGFYYLKTRQWGCDQKWYYKKELSIDYLYGDGNWRAIPKDFVIQVVAPVPSYEEYKRLQEQLNEANEVITHYAEKNGYMKAIKYLNKWGVK